MLWVTLGTTIGLATIAIGGLVILVVSRTITWRDIEQNIPWGLVFLYGGALTLSNALSQDYYPDNPEIYSSVGFLANQIEAFIGDHPFLMIVSFLLLA